VVPALRADGAADDEVDQRGPHRAVDQRVVDPRHMEAAARGALSRGIGRHAFLDQYPTLFAAHVTAFLDGG